MGNIRLTLILGAFSAISAVGQPAYAPSQASGPVSTATLSVWSPAKAAAYLGKRSTWWISWPSSARDHGTFCVSCHTATPFSLGRAALRGALGEAGTSPNEQKVLDSVTKRVRSWHDVEPFYSDQARGLPKSSESRGTESILNSLILVWRDAPTG